MNRLATTLGLSPELRFYDVYSLDEPELLAHIPRPALALLAIVPLTPAWDRDRRAEDAAREDYAGCGPDEPVVWFRQTIGNACGSIGLLHCAVNGPAAALAGPGSDLAAIRAEAVPLPPPERADALYRSAAFERAHRSVEAAGDTRPAPPTAAAEHSGQHFVAFVKAAGALWELEGSRKGPLERGRLADDEDVLCPRALATGLGRIMALERGAADGGGGDLRFSCIALAARKP